MFIVDNPKEKKFVRITSDDPQWQQSSSLAIYPRAGMYISPDCPNNIVSFLHFAFRNGWIKQYAYIPEKTLMWETLQK